MSEVALLAAQAPRRTPTQCGAFEATVELLVAGKRMLRNCVALTIMGNLSFRQR